VQLSFGATPALRGASLGARQRRDPGRHGTRAVRANQPCCTAWPASSSPTRARSSSPAGESTPWASRRAAALRRDHFGFVFQFGQLVPELTAEENVALPLLLGGASRARLSTRLGPGSSPSASTGWSGADPGSCQAAKPSGSPGSRPGSPTRGPLRRRTDRVAGLADRRAGDGTSRLSHPAAGHYRRPRHPRGARRRVRRPRGRCPRRQSQLSVSGSSPVVTRLGLRLTLNGRQRGGRTPGHHRRGRRRWCRHALDSPRRHERHQRPERPQRLAQHRLRIRARPRHRWARARAARTPRQSLARPTRCGGCQAPISSRPRPSTWSMSPPPARTLPSRPAFLTCPARDSSTPLPR
jgi:putative ABC transport system ATP-binding protein